MTGLGTELGLANLNSNNQLKSIKAIRIAEHEAEASTYASDSALCPLIALLSTAKPAGQGMLRADLQAATESRMITRREADFAKYTAGLVLLIRLIGQGQSRHVIRLIFLIFSQQYQSTNDRPPNASERTNDRLRGLAPAPSGRCQIRMAKKSEGSLIA